MSVREASEAHPWRDISGSERPHRVLGLGRRSCAAMAQGHDDDDDDDEGAGGQTSVIVRTREKLKKPNMYRVLLLNDDYTPMDFVVSVLVRYFAKSLEDAFQITWLVHESGVGECGVYTYEIAETKVTQVMDHARKNQHPLQCVMEET